MCDHRPRRVRVTGSGAVLNGTINPLGANVYWDFQWGTDPTMSTYTDAECNIVS